MAPVLDRGLDGSQVSQEFAGLVQDELVDGLGARAVFEGGLEVHTTLDLEAQVAAREILYGPAGYLAYPDNPDAALVSIEPPSGKYWLWSETARRVRSSTSRPSPAAARQLVQDLRAYRRAGARHRPRDDVPFRPEVL